MAITCKILDYQISLRKKGAKIDIKNEVGVKTVSFNKFAEDSLKCLPAVVRNAIMGDITYANIFDKFLNKLFEWEDEETL
jgi:hypothetical protein